MHFSTFLIAATALCATSASGKCFQYGQYWGDHPAAKEQLAEACKELKGKYTPNEISGLCRNNPSGQVSYNFEIQCATSASGKCFQHGQHWGDHPATKEQLAEACKELKGKYTPNEISGLCCNNPSGQVSYNFEIQNYTGEDAQISQDECERNIGAQIDHCGHGGEIITSGMRFRGDPNKGQC